MERGVFRNPSPLQAQRIYDTELAAAAAGRRVSSAQIPSELVEVPAITTTFNLVPVAPAAERFLRYANTLKYRPSPPRSTWSEWRPPQNGS